MIAAIGLVLFVVDAVTGPSSVDLDLDAEADETYLLRCDRAHEPWVWVTAARSPIDE